MSLTLSGADDQRYLVGVTPTAVTQVDVTTAAGRSLHPMVHDSVFAQRIGARGYRRLAVQAGRTTIVIARNSP